MRPETKKKPGRRFRHIQGVPVCPGIAIGRVFLLHSRRITPQEVSLKEDQVEAEIDRFKQAVQTAREEIEQIRRHVERYQGEQEASIFETHLVILDDQQVMDETIAKVRERRRNADFVFHEVITSYESALVHSGHSYWRERAADIQDVSSRVIRNLHGERLSGLEELDTPSIIVAYDLAPSDTVRINRDKILAFVTEAGGKTSHTAILARALEIPSVVGLKDVCTYAHTGDWVVVDGRNGDVFLNPANDLLDRYQDLNNENYERGKRLTAIRNLPARTLDGADVELSANIEFPDEVPAAKTHGVQGIGLYRTEYLYLTRSVLPPEEDQFAQYKEVAEEMYPAPVIIRTVDIGGDKNPPSFRIPREDNPFLGWRAIRVCLRRPEIFMPQLRAILRASVQGNVKIMFPMISNLGELRACKKFLTRAKNDLKKDGLPYDEDIEIGIMVETPSAALMANELAKEVQFLSLGTNDLIQYTTAVDRGNEMIATLFQEFHPAILRLIQQVVQAGHHNGIWVGICGEMATDPRAAIILLGLGLDEMSVPSPFAPEMKRIIRSVSMVEAKQAAERALSMSTAREVERYMNRFMKKRFPENGF